MYAKWNTLFSATTDRWETSVALKNALYKEFSLNYDPCPCDGNTDGLAPLFSCWYGKRVFCNPPYGRGITQWLERGFEAEIAVYLLPARTDTGWFHRICVPYAEEIRFVRGRLKFGSASSSAPFPSVIVVFRYGTKQGRLY
jgi:site-specific DNA-methyltransferase (adenine-specific)